MNFQVRPLIKEDIEQAAEIDKKWFGEYAISEKDLSEFIQQHPENSLGIFADDKLEGFTMFEVCDHQMPKDYIGKIEYTGKALFLSSFTTITNYNKNDWSVDERLLEAVEEKAKELGCKEIWEGLSIDHPYRKENNPDFDAYGFYTSHGFSVDEQNPLAWEPNSDLSIPCYLFRKSI